MVLPQNEPYRSSSEDELTTVTGSGASTAITGTAGALLVAPPSFAEGITFVEGNIFGAIVTVVAGIDGLAVGIGRSSGGIGGAVGCISFGASCGAAGVIDVEGLGTAVVTGGGPAFGEDSGTVVGEGGGASVGTGVPRAIHLAIVGAGFGTTCVGRATKGGNTIGAGCATGAGNGIIHIGRYG